MPYYGEGLPYYYGGAFANHSSLMTGTPRSFHTPLSRFSPHLSTISESPLTGLRRYSPSPVASRPRRVIDTADIDVSTPRVLSGDGTHQRNRLRRDRPTIKIRSQALKDNPALREHNERHEKTVGELLVEKFLIKDKKLDDAAERRLQLFHQVSLDREEEDDEAESSGEPGKIIRRFTRRRSSADIQLDPEQLEKEMAYAQVEAKVLDSLVAEEQAEIENEVRRGTLIKKGTVVGRKPSSGFYRATDKEAAAAAASASASQGEEDSQKIRKSLKKVKKKKRSAEKPPDDDAERERRSSSSSDASVDLQSGENKDRKLSRPQIFKIEASNSVGDFSTVWVNAEPQTGVEQFRESVKIPVPRRKAARKIEPDSVEEVDESEPEVVLLPVKKPYVKDTSRNSVYFTVKTPPEVPKSDPMESQSFANGVAVERKGKVEEKSLEKSMDKSRQQEAKSIDGVTEDVAAKKKTLTNGVASRSKETLDNSTSLEGSRQSDQIANEVTWKRTRSETSKDSAKTEESKILKDEVQAVKKEDLQMANTESPRTQKTNGFAWRKREKSESLEESKSKDDVVLDLKKEDTLKQPSKLDSPKVQKSNEIGWRKREKSEPLEESKSPKDDVIPVLKKDMAKQPSKLDSPKVQKSNEIGWRKREKSESLEESKSPKDDVVLDLKKEDMLKQSSKLDSPKVQKTNELTWRKREKSEPLEESKSPKDDVIPDLKKDTLKQSSKLDSPKVQKTNEIGWRKREKSESLEESKSPKDDVVLDLKKEDTLKQPSKLDSPKVQKTNELTWRKREKSEPLEDSKSPKDDVIPILKKDTAKQPLKLDSPKLQKTNEVAWRKREKSEPLEEPKSPKNDVTPDPKKLQKTNELALRKREKSEPLEDSKSPKDVVAEPRKKKVAGILTPGSPKDSEEVLKRLDVPRPRNRLQASSQVSSSATLAVDPLGSENSASVALPSGADGLPKPSKITTDENNAVEAPKPALRGPEQRLATKSKRDEDVGDTLPGNQAGGAATLRDAHAFSSSIKPEDRPEYPEDLSKSKAISDATGLANDASKTTFSEKTEVSSGCSIEDAADRKVNGSSVAEGPKGPFKIAKRPAKVEPVQFPWRKKKAEESVSSEASPQDSPKTPVEDVAEDKVNGSAAIEEECQGPFKVAQKAAKVEQVPWRKKKALESKDPEPKKTLREETSIKTPVDSKPKMFEGVNGEAGGALSKSTSTESIDFWSEIKGPESPLAAKAAKVAKGLSFPGARNEFEDPAEEEERLDEKKESVAKISVAGVGSTAQLSNVPVIGQKPEEPMKSIANAGAKEPKKRKNLSIQIDRAEEAYSTIKKTPLKRDDSLASTVSGRSVGSTPDTSVPGSQVGTPVYDVAGVPLINIVEVVTPTNAYQLTHPEEDDEARTPTNEWPDSGLPKISKWEKQGDLSNVDRTDKDATPTASKVGSVAATPEDTPQGTPESSKKKKLVRKKKASTTKKSSAKDSKKESKKEAKESKKSSAKLQESSKLASESKSSSKATQKQVNPSPKPLDLIRMFYTTPSALLTATPRDLSKVRRAKIKRRKHHSRTPSVSSDSTRSTTSTATTGSTDGSGSTCTELDDDPDKRMNSTRSNDSGFDGSPRISTPSQSSDTQRNSDSSDHFPSGRITPPATNLPRFKKYAVTDFHFRKVLGKGSFGKVLLAELKGTECVYAVKCLKKDVVLEDDDVECTLIERKVLTLATRHPYLCHLFCTFQTESHLFFVMEYLNGGDLMFHIQKSGRFPESRARFYAAEIWSGLNFLHRKGIVYRDLKLDNVLLDFEGHIRIADFGMCKLQIFLDRTADTFCGTPDYMAPEVIKGLKYNQAVDWWSYGVLLYEMLTAQSPFSGCDEDELFWSICNERPFIPRYLSQDSTDMLLCLLEKDAGKRLPGHDIAYHAFFQSLPWDRLERRQLEPPFKPALEHTLDTKYFDTAFTAERPRLTPVPDQILTSMDQGVFRGFSYTNPNATD